MWSKLRKKVGQTKKYELSTLPSPTLPSYDDAIVDEANIQNGQQIHDLTLSNNLKNPPLSPSMSRISHLQESDIAQSVGLIEVCQGDLGNRVNSNNKSLLHPISSVDDNEHHGILLPTHTMRVSPTPQDTINPYQKGIDPDNAVQGSGLSSSNSQGLGFVPDNHGSMQNNAGGPHQDMCQSYLSPGSDDPYRGRISSFLGGKLGSPSVLPFASDLPYQSSCNGGLAAVGDNKPGRSYGHDGVDTQQTDCIKEPLLAPPVLPPKKKIINRSRSPALQEGKQSECHGNPRQQNVMGKVESGLPQKGLQTQNLFVASNQDLLVASSPNDDSSEDSSSPKSDDLSFLHHPSIKSLKSTSSSSSNEGVESGYATLEDIQEQLAKFSAMQNSMSVSSSGASSLSSFSSSNSSSISPGGSGLKDVDPKFFPISRESTGEEDVFQNPENYSVNGTEKVGAPKSRMVCSQSDSVKISSASSNMESSDGKNMPITLQGLDKTQYSGPGKATSIGHMAPVKLSSCFKPNITKLITGPEKITTINTTTNNGNVMDKNKDSSNKVGPPIPRFQPTSALLKKAGQKNEEHKLEKNNTVLKNGDTSECVPGTSAGLRQTQRQDFVNNNKALSVAALDINKNRSEWMEEGNDRRVVGCIPLERDQAEPPPAVEKDGNNMDADSVGNARASMNDGTSTTRATSKKCVAAGRVAAMTLGGQLAGGKLVQQSSPVSHSSHSTQDRSGERDTTTLSAVNNARPPMDTLSQAQSEHDILRQPQYERQQAGSAYNPANSIVVEVDVHPPPPERTLPQNILEDSWKAPEKEVEYLAVDGSSVSQVYNPELVGPDGTKASGVAKLYASVPKSAGQKSNEEETSQISIHKLISDTDVTKEESVTSEPITIPYKDQDGDFDDTDSGMRSAVFSDQARDISEAPTLKIRRVSDSEAPRKNKRPPPVPSDCPSDDDILNVFDDEYDEGIEDYDDDDGEYLPPIPSRNYGAVTPNSRTASLSTAATPTSASASIPIPPYASCSNSTNVVEPQVTSSPSTPISITTPLSEKTSPIAASTPPPPPQMNMTTVETSICGVVSGPQQPATSPHSITQRPAMTTTIVATIQITTRSDRHGNQVAQPALPASSTPTQMLPGQNPSLTDSVDNSIYSCQCFANEPEHNIIIPAQPQEITEDEDPATPKHVVTEHLATEDIQEEAEPIHMSWEEVMQEAKNLGIPLRSRPMSAMSAIDERVDSPTESDCSVTPHQTPQASPIHSRTSKVRRSVSTDTKKRSPFKDKFKLQNLFSKKSKAEKENQQPVDMATLNRKTLGHMPNKRELVRNENGCTPCACVCTTSPRLNRVRSPYQYAYTFTRGHPGPGHHHDGHLSPSHSRNSMGSSKGSLLSQHSSLCSGSVNSSMSQCSIPSTTGSLSPCPGPALSPGGQSTHSNGHRSLNADFIASLAKLKECGWYWGPLGWDDAEAKLNGRPDGSFLVRDSSDDRYILSLSFRSQNTTHHTRIEHYKGMFSFYSQPKSHGAATIVEFIDKAMEHSRNGKFLYFLRPRAPGLPPAPVQLLYPISRFQNLQSLQHTCRFVILKTVRRDHIDRLPIPPRMKEYLKQSQYYTEHYSGIDAPDPHFMTL